MYGFAFYFFYGILSGRAKDAVFTSKLAMAVIVVLHLVTIAKILVYLKVINGIPIFSSTYLHNKLYWYIPILLLFGIIFFLFDKSKTKEVIDKYSKTNFYSIGNVFLFLLFIIIPIILIAML